jgi:cytochrome c551/c552
MFRSIKQWSIAALSTVFVMSVSGVSAQEPNGEALFKAKCQTCHQPHKDGTGPALAGVRQRWADGGAKEGSIYLWVANWKAAAAVDPYAAGVTKLKPTEMNVFPDLAGKTDEINAIFDYVDAQPDPATVTEGATAETGAAGAEAEEEGGLSWIWIVLGIVFVVIILGVGGVRRQLKDATRVAAGEATDRDDLTYSQEFGRWAWKNRKYVGLGGLALTITVVVGLFLALYSIDVKENYHPSQPIQFPHDVHTGANGIDCKYCHNSVTKSKSAGLPTVNVCMNCHKQITGDGEQVDKIKAIYAAAGWDGSQYTGKTKEIVWNKVHVLPDHVYFNHQQHVVAGGVDCKQCHGDMTKQNETVMVQPVSELNKIEGNVQLTKATLTMGWCIECHQEKEISDGNLAVKKNAYYDEIHRRLLNNDRELYDKYLEDGKVTVKELGGWECAKCHY